MKRNKMLGLLWLFLLFTVPCFATDINFEFTDPNTPGSIVGYKVYDSTVGVTGPFNMIQTIAGTGAGGGIVAFTADLAPGIHYVRVTAYNSWQESQPSNTVSTGDNVAPADPSVLEIVIFIDHNGKSHVIKAEEFFRQV